ncbi:MAG: HAD family hydrolase [Sporichthyaceae bacterium]
MTERNEGTDDVVERSEEAELEGLPNRRRPAAFLFDVDGVLRVWEAGEVAEIEERYGLIPGTLNAVAYDLERFGPALLGEITDQDWRAAVTAAMVPICGDVKVAIKCVIDWSARFGRIDHEVAEVIAELRRAGAQVGLIANSTDRLQEELTRMGVKQQVDAVVDSAHEGVAKPDAAIFLRAAEVLEVEPEACLYVGARAEHVAGAERIGMVGHLYGGVEGLREMIGRLPAG